MIHALRAAFLPFPLAFFPFPVFFVPLLGLAVGVGIAVAVVVGAAPRTRSRPSFKVSVMIGLAAGRYLNSFEYLRGGGLSAPGTEIVTAEGREGSRAAPTMKREDDHAPARVYDLRRGLDCFELESEPEQEYNE